MAKFGLRPEIIEKIKTDPVLFGKVMEQIETTPTYGLQLLYNNNVKLTQAGVLQILKDYLKVSKDSDLLEKLQEKSSIKTTRSIAAIVFITILISSCGHWYPGNYNKYHSFRTHIIADTTARK